MNQELQLQDAGRKSRMLNLQITGSPVQGEGAEAAVFQVISEAIPLALLAYASTPDRQTLLTARDFWAEDGNPAGQARTNMDETSYWVPLEVSPDSAAVRAQYSLVLSVVPDGAAEWHLADDASEQGVELPVLRKLTLTEGLLGLPEWREYLFYDPGFQDPVGVLIPLSQHSVSLAVVNPFEVLPDYTPSVSGSDVDMLADGRGEDLSWISIMNIQDEPFQVYVNLLGPVVYNPITGLGKQVVLSNSGYSASYPLGAAVSEQGR